MFIPTWKQRKIIISGQEKAYHSYIIHQDITKFWKDIIGACVEANIYSACGYPPPDTWTGEDRWDDEVSEGIPDIEVIGGDQWER